MGLKAQAKTNEQIRRHWFYFKGFSTSERCTKAALSPACIIWTVRRLKISGMISTTKQRLEDIPYTHMEAEEFN